MNKIEIKNLDADVLKKEIVQLKKELFNLRLKSISGEIKDYSQFKKLRLKVAQGLTFLNQKTNKIDKSKVKHV